MSIISVKVKDIYQTEVELGFSRSGFYRIDFKNEKSFPERVHNGDKIPNCLSFDRGTAKVLYEALGSMIEIDDE